MSIRRTGWQRLGNVLFRALWVGSSKAGLLQNGSYSRTSRAASRTFKISNNSLFCSRLRAAMFEPVHTGLPLAPPPPRPFARAITGNGRSRPISHAPEDLDRLSPPPETVERVSGRRIRAPLPERRKVTRGRYVFDSDDAPVGDGHPADLPPGTRHDDRGETRSRRARPARPRRQVRRSAARTRRSDVRLLARHCRPQARHRHDRRPPVRRRPSSPAPAH